MTMRLIARLALALSIAVTVAGRSEAADGDPQTPASPNHTPLWQAEAWYFYQHTTDTAELQKLTLRFYQPFQLPGGWQVTMREDIRGLSTNEKGPDNPDGAWRAHLGDMFVQAALKTPPVAPGLAVDLGLRFVFPTAGLPPYGTGRFQMGPHFGFIWDLPASAGMVTLAPLVSYLTSVGDGPRQSVESSVLQFHPIVSVRPWAGLTICLWREHPLILDTRTNRWFIPFDAIASYEIMPHLSLGVGAAVRLAGENRLFDNIVYGRVALSF
jgi:hypothetical protein